MRKIINLVLSFLLLTTKATYNQLCIKNSTGEYNTFRLSLSLTHTGTATIQITRS